jgi:predicted Zn-dependent protease
VKRALAFAAVVLVAVAAIYFAERKPRTDAVSPNAVVNMAADWQRDLSRAPLHVTRISDIEETRIGDELAHRYDQESDPYSAEEQALQRYVNAVGGRVAAHAQRKLSYRFHLVPNEYLINAFALPGGHVFIGKGLLDQMTSEDELAFVLGHEIEHIDHYHAVERVQVEAQLKHLNLDVVAAIASIPMSLWQAGYTKQEEFEADREGLRAAVSAGYSAQGAIKMLNNFDRLHSEYVIHAKTPTEELSRMAIEGLEGYFRSHPLPAERLAQVTDLIAREHLATPPLKPFRIEYEVSTRKR